MTDAVHEVLAKPYKRTLAPDPSGGYTVTVHEFPGCVAHGSTPNRALAKFETVACDWIAAAISTGYPISEPSDYSDSSGKIALRLSRRIHQIAAEQADLEGVSINQLLATAIAHYLGQSGGLQRAEQRLTEACTELVKQTTLFSQTAIEWTAKSTPALSRSLPEPMIFGSEMFKVFPSTGLAVRHGR